MRRSNNWLLYTFITVLFITSFSFSQDEDQLYFIHEEKAKVDMLKKYNETSKEWVEMAKGGKLDIEEIRVSQTDDNHFFYLMKIKNYSEIDGLGDKFTTARDIYGKEKWSAMTTDNAKTMEWTEDYVLRWSGKYSYVPKEKRLKIEEIGFTHFDYFYCKPGFHKEVTGILSQWKEIYEKAGIANQYNIWLVEMGRENNLIVVTESARDEVEYYQLSKQTEEKVSAQTNPLWEKLMTYLNHFEHKNGRPRQDLYYRKDMSISGN